VRAEHLQVAHRDDDAFDCSIPVLFCACQMISASSLRPKYLGMKLIADMLQMAS
jgi:hypothetical protein